MLARSGRLPARAWAYEIKWDGFRAIVSTEGDPHVRSRRGWNMTPLVGFLAELPVRAVLDGQQVAFGADGKPDFELVCERMLHRHAQIPLTFLVFDLLRLDGRDLRRKPYAERRGILEALGLEGDRAGRCRSPSRTGRRYGRPLLTTSSRMSSPSGSTSPTSPVSERG